MNSNRFLQLHTLTSYPASLLNRDDVGFAKRMPFGGASRTRISSQCLKRHWRVFEGEHSLKGLDAPGSIRSRYTFEQEILKPLVSGGVSDQVARAVTSALMTEVLGKSEKAEKAEASEEDESEKKGKRGGKKSADDDSEPGAVQTKQITVLGRPEVDFLLKEARAISASLTDPSKAAAAVKAHFKGEKRKNLAGLKLAAGLDAAMFGRMVTSDLLARGDAAVHVAHAFTVHVEASESDYFSAVDDLSREVGEGGHGSGHIGSTELTSGLFYGYVVVDLPLLISNLEGTPVGASSADRMLAAKVTERLVRMIATVSPGAKLGSTAPYAYAQLVIAELGNTQPRTFANAFLKPVSQRDDVVENAYQALARHVNQLDGMYGAGVERRLSGLGTAGALADALKAGTPVPLEKLASWVSDAILKA
jgi:CRISPR system Cascade subunit CasC